METCAALLSPLPAQGVDLDVDIGIFSYHKALTPVDVAGIGSAELGAVYAASYAWYVYSNEQEELKKEARKAEKRAAAAAKKQAAKDAAAKKMAKEELVTTE